MKLTSQSQQQGGYYEQLALEFLQQQGLTLIEKNWHCRHGELDLIMLDNQQNVPCLVVVEVRQRKIGDFGTVLDSITPSKQRKIIQATEIYLFNHLQWNHCDVRFDVVAFSLDNHGQIFIEWITSAFLAG